MIFRSLLFQLDALEYIHSKDYVHADIKATNLLCDKNKNVSCLFKQI